MHFGDHLDIILTSFWSNFGDLGEHFGDLGGSWKQVGILMDFGSNLGTKKFGTGHGGGRGGTPQKQSHTGFCCGMLHMGYEIRSRRGCGMKVCLTQTLPSGMRARPD